MTARYLRVKNWEEFQHYKDRNPPWIKLHRDLLRNYEFTCLQDASKLHLMLIWLLASQMDNCIPADEDFIKNQTGVKGKINFNELISLGFLIDDSNMLATCKQGAILETETETETEKEVIGASGDASPKKIAVNGKRGTRIPEDWQPSEDLRRAIADKEGFNDEQIDHEVYQFRNYWQSASGVKAVKLDWPATFRKWCAAPYCDSRQGIQGTVRRGGGSQGGVQFTESLEKAAIERQELGRGPASYLD